MLATRLLGLVTVCLGLLIIICRRRYAAMADGTRTTPAQDRVNRVLIWVVGTWFVLGGSLMAITGETEF